MLTTRKVLHDYKIHVELLRISIPKLLTASPTHDTILILKLHYFSAVLALNVFDSPTTTPNLALKKYFPLLNY